MSTIPGAYEPGAPSRNRFQQNILEVGTPADIPLEKFRAVMERDTFVCIRGIVTPEEITAAIAAMAARFSRADDHPSVGQSPANVRTNFQMLKIGGESRRVANDDARLFRVFYNPIWAEDIYGLRDVFIRMAKVRNVITGMPENFAVEKIEPNGLWTASRIHQYPTGGGFFRRHTDYVADDVATESGTTFHQLLLMMSRQGEHFQEGGGFLDLRGERISLEDHFCPGDILVYDGRSTHGVEDIDAHLPLDLDTFSGRAAALVTLFKLME